MRFPQVLIFVLMLLAVPLQARCQSTITFDLRMHCWDGSRQNTCPPNPNDADSIGELLSTTVRYSVAYPHDFGYGYASVDLKYRFIACDGAVHVAYSLDRASLSVNPNYSAGGINVQSSKAPPPELASIGFHAEVRAPFNPTIIAYVDDAFAGESLGYGCFTAQSKEVGKVEKLVGKNATRERIKAYLATLTLTNAIVQPFRPLRNDALEALGKEEALRRKYWGDPKGMAPAETSKGKDYWK